MKIMSITRNTYGGQSKGCWLDVQIGYTLIRFYDLWGNRDRHQGPFAHLFIFAPSHDPRVGYSRRHCGIWFNVPWRKNQIRLHVGGGDHYSSGIKWPWA